MRPEKPLARSHSIKTVNFTELKFADKRKAKPEPTQIWGLLLWFAKHNGMIEVVSNANMYQLVSRLNTGLGIFGITGRAIEYLAGSYRTRFTISDNRRGVSEMGASGRELNRKELLRLLDLERITQPE